MGRIHISIRRIFSLRRALYPAIMLASLFSPLLLSADAPVVRAMFQENETVIEVRLPESFYTYIASPNAIALLVDIDEQSRALFGEPRYPQGTQKGEELIARGNFVICIPFLPGAQPGQAVGVSLRLRMQVCDEEQDLCYPPGWYRVMLAEPGVWRDAITEGWNNGSPPSSMEESITKRLARAGDTIILALLLAFAGGILASLTPCVYPVIPVIIGFFTQEDPPHSALPGAQDRALESGSRGRWRRFSGVLVFVLSMALVYTALGLTAGLIGGAFASFISTPPFFLAAALLFLFLALSLLDVFEFRLPFAVRNPSHRKRLLRAAGMGLIIGLIALPCVGPVIFFILTEIMQKGDMLSGAFLMLAFSLGMGVLFFALALLGKRFSDMLRAGGWMLYVKIALAGFVFMSALSFLEQGLRPLVSDGYIYTAKSLFLLFALWLSWKNFVKLYGRNTPFAFAAAGVLVALFIISIMPRAALAWGDNLDLALEEARSGGRKIFVDISAPWCALCRELEEEIMASGTLRNFIETRSIPLRLDYDTNEERLARDYDVRSLPCVLVLDADGQVIWRRGGGGVKSLAAELSNVLE